MAGGKGSAVQDDDLDDPSLVDEDLPGGGDDGLDDGLDGTVPGGDEGQKKGEGEPGGGDDEIDIEIESDLEQDAEPADGGGAKDNAEREDKTEYGKKVQARIAREQRLTREAREQATAERAARVKAQSEALQAKREALEVTRSALDVQIQALQDALVKTKDDGKTKEEVELQSKLNDLQGRRGNVARAEEALKAEEEEIKRGAAAPAPNPLAEAWKRRNVWFGNARYGEQTGIARIIDVQLSHEGYDKNSPTYYAELDRRLRVRCPELTRFAQRPAAGNGERQQRRDPTGGAPRGALGGGGGGDPAGRTAGRSGKVVLTRADQENMRAFGLDPKDREHCLEYARNKVRDGRNG